MTQTEINKLIEKVNLAGRINTPQLGDGEGYITNEEYNSLFPFFDKLTIDELYIDGILQGDIYTDFAKLKNLDTLIFHNVDLTETEEYEGFEKLKKLVHLFFYYCRLSKFPSSIFKLKNLSILSIYGSFNDISNIHFFRKNKDKNLEQEFEDAFQYNILTANYEKFKWGYKFENFFIVLHGSPGYAIDAFEEELDIDVYFFKSESLYTNFSAVLSVFKEMDNKLDCFKKKHNELDYTTIYGDETINIYELKQKYRIGEKKYGNHFIDKLLINIGGTELLTEIKNAEKKEQVIKTIQFDKNNKFIESAKISNFKIFDTLEIEKLDKINIVVGKNGCGKTSLLQSIALGLVPQHSTNWIPDNSSYNTFVNSVLNSKTRTSDSYAEIKLTWSKFESEHRLYLDSFYSDNELPQTYLALGYGENLFTNSRNGTDIFIDELARGDSKSYNIETLFNNYNVSLPDPLQILSNLTNWVSNKYSHETKQELIEISSILQKTLNKFLSLQAIQNFTIEKIGYDFYFVDKNQTNLSLYQISEGYRSNIVLITDILIKILAARKNLFLKPIKIEDIFKTVKGTILIDEFDKHLHPVWQRTFLSALEKELPNIQFILTTHNVVALQSAEGYKAFVLNQDGKLTVEEIKKGWSIEALYKKFFDKEYFSEKISNEIQKLVTMRNEMIQKNDYTALESDEFKTIIKNLEVSLQTKMIANIELNQIEINKLNNIQNNEQTKKNSKANINN